MIDLKCPYCMCGQNIIVSENVVVRLVCGHNVYVTVDSIPEDRMHRKGWPRRSECNLYWITPAEFSMIETQRKEHSHAN